MTTDRTDLCRELIAGGLFALVPGVAATISCSP